MLTLAKVAILLSRYGYFLIFPLAVIEGPIITIIAGFFVTTGTFHPFIVYGLVVAGDVIGDSFLYFIGKGGGPIMRRILGGPKGDAKLESARHFFLEHRKKALILSKVIHGVGMSGLIAAGSLRVPYRKFFLTCLSVSLVQSAVFLTIGILFGHAYAKAGAYLGYFGIATAVAGLGLIVFLIIKFKARLR